MRYFFINSPFSVTLFFTLSFLTLALSLNTTQFEVMKNINDIFDLHNDGDPCQWYGVSCSINGGNDVVGLRFSGFHLNNSIWQYVCKLPALQLLDLSNNTLQLSSLNNLRTLDLTHNQLTGPIPSQLSSLKNLQTLDLSYNQLTGQIPEALGNMSVLQWLDLSNNKLTGQIPEALGNMSELYRLDLSNNKLTGQIPEHLWLGSAHATLNLSNNKLTGQIPEHLGAGGTLASLDLSNNKLTGQIPEHLGAWGTLASLDLSNNKLTGQIPEHLWLGSAHATLNLSNNKLTGQIPEHLGAGGTLASLDLSNNKLTGQIPEHLGAWSTLASLDLSNNKLTGKIPESVKYIPYLDLSNNELEEAAPTGKSHSTVLKVLGAVAVVAVFIICFLVFGVLWIRKLHNREEFKQTFRKILQKVEHPRISHEELLAVTNRFHNSNLLSTNSFGSVYKGFLADGTRVAVKVLNLMHEQSHKIFRAECKVLQKARHRNLARIITTCSTIHIKALIFEYFSNGSLEKHLYQGSCGMGLRTLLNIAIDIANAVEYLHYDCFVQIVHCDIKPSNVLLDESMTAHLSDFGISRLMGRIAANSVTSTIDLKGSVGYIAPEYGLNGMMSPRGDVYSYGILLLEMLTRRQPTDNMFDGDLSLNSWVKRAFPERVAEVVDTSLLMEGVSKETEECLISLMRLGLLCSSDSPEARPTMRDVSNLLKNIQQDFIPDTSSSIKLKPTISNLVCDRGAINISEEASDTQSSTF